ncbi:MAG: DUF4166 domain-containing protein [Pseudomonadota bacterium]
MKILILGGYGMFGGRLVELLGDDPALTFMVAGRSLDKAQAFCDGLDIAAELVPLELDRLNIAAAIETQRPDLVVDASGPFQAYGGDPYHVAKEAIAAGIDYYDFADGAEFASGIDQLDQAARSADVTILSGVSSFPILSGAVLAELEDKIPIEKVEAGIAPSPFAGFGMSVMRAVLSYAGTPIERLESGQKAAGLGLVESRYFTIAPPGKTPLRRRRFTLIDVPDLTILPHRYPRITDIWFGVGTLPAYLHRLLSLMARMRRYRLLPRLDRFSGVAMRALRALRAGEDRGGMYVAVSGKGRRIEWHLLAETTDGPYIPSLPIAALIKKRMKGQRFAAGARIPKTELSLKDILDCAGDRAIFAGFREPIEGSLFERHLGKAMIKAPQIVQNFHKLSAPQRYVGEAKITRGTHPIARLIARLMGFPDAGENVPAAVTISRDADQERWTREFAGKEFQSVLTQGKGKDQYLMRERFGPITISLAIVVEGDRIYFNPRRWDLLGIPMPKFLLPDGGSYETERDRLYHFDVKMTFPIIGLIVAYRGWLKPAA